VVGRGGDKSMLLCSCGVLCDHVVLASSVF